MKDKEKQIEEMTKDLKENLRLCAGVKLLDHNVETIAYELSKKYQPKLPEHSVVLSGKQCVEIVQDNYNIGYERGSKETAEKILKWLKEHCAFAGFVFVETYFREEFGTEIKE